MNLLKWEISDYMADDKYCYLNTNVLKNKFDIRDIDELHTKERLVSSLAILKVQTEFVKGNFDFKHLQAIHKVIFNEIYEWAGKIRTVDIAKVNLFCRVQFLDSYAQDIFGRLKQDKFLIGMDKDQAIKKLAEYMGDINALHPFREGNGRTQREFIGYLSKATGIVLDLGMADSDKMMEASLKSFNTDYSGFQQIFFDIATPMSLQAQESFLKSVSPMAYREFKDLKQNMLLPDRQREFTDDRLSKQNQFNSMADWKKEIEKEKAQDKGSSAEKVHSKTVKER